MAENQKKLMKVPKEEDIEREVVAEGEKKKKKKKKSCVDESMAEDAEFSQAETLVEASRCPCPGKDDRSSSSHSGGSDGERSAAVTSVQPVVLSAGGGGGEDVKPDIASPVALINSGFKGQFGMSHQQLLASVTAQAAKNQAQMEVQTAYPPSSDLLPASVKQSISSSINPAPSQPSLPAIPQDSDTYISEVDQQKSLDQKVKPPNIAVKAPSADGYNWRKYGQKLVKSNESSRSYYRCTQTNCHAKKKVEHCDHSGCVIAIVYKGRHNHEPPRKIRCTKARRSISSTGPTSSAACPGRGNEAVDNLVKKLKDSDSSALRRERRHSKPEKQLQNLSRCDNNAIIKAENDHDDEPNAKRRMKEGDVGYSAPLFKAVKEPKIVVQAAGDAGISGDGYRWRKYGQKMVKGNPNPRSYYKCTSAGCPVRKHVERAVDGTTTVIITYEGKHDHDMPVPKKRHGPPSAGLLIAAAAAMNNAQIKKSETSANQKTSTTQWSMDVEGESASEKASELGGEKALESARTLLSIGIELRPY